MGCRVEWLATTKAGLSADKKNFIQEPRVELAGLLELLEALIYGCGCFLELTAAGANVGAGVAGYKAHKKSKAKRDAALTGQTVPTDNSALWIFAGAAFLAIVSTGLVLWKWVR